MGSNNQIEEKTLVKDASKKETSQTQTSNKNKTKKKTSQSQASNKNKTQNASQKKGPSKNNSEKKKNVKAANETAALSETEANKETAAVSQAPVKEKLNETLSETSVVEVKAAEPLEQSAIVQETKASVHTKEIVNPKRLIGFSSKRIAACACLLVAFSVGYNALIIPYKDANFAGPHLTSQLTTSTVCETTTTVVTTEQITETTT